MYFPVDPVSIGDLTLLNGVLFYALWEMQLRDDHDFDPQDIASYKSICDANFRAGVEVAEIAAVATYEHTLALNLAVSDRKLYPDFTSNAILGILRANEG